MHIKEINWNEWFCYDPRSPSHLRWKKRLFHGGKKIEEGNAGTMGSDGYWQVSFNRKLYKVHRVVWELFNGKIPSGMFIDHIDGNKFNNVIGNLRLATKSQNNCNRKSKGRLLPKGIAKDRVGFKCYVMVNGNTRSFWTIDLLDAVAWVRRTRIELHGEFCNHG